jgi:NAD(P)-dependent dehydrogenase (short-subunit alcohol dehydrogenase family)
MQLQAGQVAVVTGGASGIGRAMVDAFAARGLNIVLADIEAQALEVAAAEVEAASGVQTMRAVVDVRNLEQLQQLAIDTIERFGRIDVVCNNAGVIGHQAPIWEQESKDWDWVLGVNLMGVANGIRAFVPHLVAQNSGHVVNTASIAGLLAIPRGGNGPYTASKFAVVGMSEMLREELDHDAPAVGVTVICPGPVNSRIRDSDRNRPAELAIADAPDPSTSRFMAANLMIEATTVADLVVQAIESDKFYLLTNTESADDVRARVDRLLADL